MSDGKQRAARFMLAAQATLVWQNDTTDVDGFIETGSFNGGRSGVLPFDPAMRAEWCKIFEGK